jgi:hypothetical protein
VKSAIATKIARGELPAGSRRGFERCVVIRVSLASRRRCRETSASHIRNTASGATDCTSATGPLLMHANPRKNASANRTAPPATAHHAVRDADVRQRNPQRQLNVRRGDATVTKEKQLLAQPAAATTAVRPVAAAEHAA